MTDLQTAAIERASVDVHTVFVAGMMMTVGMYRQLRTGTLFDRHASEDDGETLYPTAYEPADVWGWVNVCPSPMCANASAHTHYIGTYNHEMIVDALPEWMDPDGYWREHTNQIFLQD